MKLNILFAIRRGFESGYPEALEVVDEGAMDENPDVLKELGAKHEANKDLMRVAWFEVKFPSGTMATIRERLIGTPSLTSILTDNKT